MCMLHFFACSICMKSFLTSSFDTIQTDCHPVHIAHPLISHLQFFLWLCIFPLNEFPPQHWYRPQIFYLSLQIRGDIAQASLCPQLGHIPSWCQGSRYVCSPSAGTLSKMDWNSSAVMASACHDTLPMTAKADQHMVFTIFTISLFPISVFTTCWFPASRAIPQ